MTQQVVMKQILINNNNNCSLHFYSVITSDVKQFQVKSRICFSGVCKVLNGSWFRLSRSELQELISLYQQRALKAQDRGYLNAAQ